MHSIFPCPPPPTRSNSPRSAPTLHSDVAVEGYSQRPRPEAAARPWQGSPQPQVMPTAAAAALQAGTGPPSLRHAKLRWAGMGSPVLRTQ